MYVSYCRSSLNITHHSYVLASVPSPFRPATQLFWVATPSCTWGCWHRQYQKHNAWPRRAAGLFSGIRTLVRLQFDFKQTHVKSVKPKTIVQNVQKIFNFRSILNKKLIWSSKTEKFPCENLELKNIWQLTHSTDASITHTHSTTCGQSSECDPYQGVRLFWSNYCNFQNKFIWIF